MHETNTTWGGIGGTYGSGRGMNHMGFHIFDADRAAKLDDPARFQFVSREELLSHLGVASERVIADLGSDTGSFTDEVAPHVSTLYAVDVQAVMYDYYREKGAPDNVEFATIDVALLPFNDDHPDAASSTMTYHGSATDEAFTELVRAVRPDSTMVVVNWSTSGSGEDGPPRDERFDLGDAVSALKAAGFTITHGEIRCEVSVCVARH